MKKCLKCGIEKELNDFYKHSEMKDGHLNICKSCKKEYTKQYHKENEQWKKEYDKQYHKDHKKEAKEYSKQYRKDNAKEIKENKKQYYEDNKEDRSKKAKKWRKENKEKKKQMDKHYRIDNREKLNNRLNERYKNDKNFRLKVNLSTSFYKFCKGKKPYRTFYNYTLEEYYDHLQSTIKPEYEGKKLHIDHIIPQSLYDPTNSEHIKKCWNPRNLRYLPAIENHIKNNKLDMDLIKEYKIEDLLP